MAFIFAGNWKMNPSSANDAKNLFNSYKKISKKFIRRGVSVIFAPATPHIGLFFGTKFPKNLKMSAQDTSIESQGAFTGRISPVQVFGLGVDYVILGHSEQREFGDTSTLISHKIKSALKAKLKPIVCIGELKRELDGEFWHELKNQIEETVFGLTNKDITNIIIAYEPVWAVGETSSGPMSPEDLHETVLFIRKVFSNLFGGKISKNLLILYGGSVFSHNANDLFRIGNVSGFLVGRESLNKIEVEKIIQAALG